MTTSKIRVRNWLMLADKNSLSKLPNSTESDSATIKNNNGPTQLNKSNELIENTANISINDYSNNDVGGGILIKFERDSPSPPPSLLLNNLSDFSYDEDDDDEDSDSEEFDGSTPSVEDFNNFNLKITSPIIWGDNTTTTTTPPTIKLENFDNEYEIPIITTTTTSIPSSIQTIVEPLTTVTATTTAAFLSAASTTIKKSTTTLVPTKFNIKPLTTTVNNPNNSTKNTNLNSTTAALITNKAELESDETDKLKVYGPACGINARTRRGSILAARKDEDHQQQQQKQPKTPKSISKSTGIRLIHKLHNKSLGKLTEISSPDQFKTTTIATAVGSDDKKYRILFQNQRMRKESLEHSSDMIYVGTETDKPWICKNCNRSYKWKNSLKCHLKNECGQPPRYFCSKMCGYRTNVHSNLKRHMNTKCKNDDTTSAAGNNGNSIGNIGKGETAAIVKAEQPKDS